MRGNKFCSELVDCPVCHAPSGEPCLLVFEIIPSRQTHIERARQSRWLQMYAESSARKLEYVFDEVFTEAQ